MACESVSSTCYGVKNGVAGLKKEKCVYIGAREYRNLEGRSDGV